MRPTFGWRDVASAGRVAVWGLGVEGHANVRRLEADGVSPVLVDDAPSGAGVIATSDGGLDLLSECDVVVKTPGISRYRDDVQALEASGVPVVGGLGLWLNETDPATVICITGTKGKSTTASVAGHLARGLGVRCFVGGNIGMPPYDPDVTQAVDLWIIEVSSYQATDVAITPPVVGVTSLHADHLDWHRTVDAYYRDKLSLTSQAGARLTVSGEDAELRRREALLGPTVRWVDAESAAPWWRQLGLVGRHNAVNAAVAATLLEEAGVPGADDHDTLARAAAGFTGLESRLQLVATVGGVEFFDDSLSTNVLPTVAAIDAFADRRVAVILGGYDRGIDYAPLAEFLAARGEPTLAATIPDSGDRIADAIEAAAPATVEVARCGDLDVAVARAHAWAQPSGVVLLSPAAPSFGRFRDYRARAAAFLAAARSCGS
jgi:UDP-N-acetylmuramoyl-L-alanine---L-glutamate ligase